MSVSATGRPNAVALRDTEKFATEYFKCPRCRTFLCDRCAAKENTSQGSPCSKCGQALSRLGFPAVEGAQVVPFTKPPKAQSTQPDQDPPVSASWVDTLDLLAEAVVAAQDANRAAEAEAFASLAAGIISRAGPRVPAAELAGLFEIAERIRQRDLPNQAAELAEALATLAELHGENELPHTSRNLASSHGQPTRPAHDRDIAEPIPARSLLECRLVAHARGLPRKSQQRVVIEDGDALLVTIRPDSFYRGDDIAFHFRVLRSDHAATSSPLRLTPDGAASRLLDPGELLAVSEEFAKGSTKLEGKPKRTVLYELRAIETAAACLDGILAAFPPGKERLTADAMRSDLGRETFAKQAARFSRGRIDAIGRAYRRVADSHRAYASAQGYLRPEDVPTA